MAYINNGDTGSSIRDKWNKGISIPLAHSKSGTVHTLYGVPTGTDYSYIVDFQATADFTEGDTFSINDEIYTSQTQNGETLASNCFKSNGWVTGIKVDVGNKILNFNSNNILNKGGTFSKLIKAGGTQDIATSQVRNIYASTVDITAGVTPLTTGTLYLVYE